MQIDAPCTLIELAEGLEDNCVVTKYWSERELSMEDVEEYWELQAYIATLDYDEIPF